MAIDEAIAKYKEITNTDAVCPRHCNIPCEKCVHESEQLAWWLEKLKTIESIMLTYNANWYADEDNGVPDCEVLESIWNVIQDNGLDIDIEQDYRKGKADGYNKAIDDFVENISLKISENIIWGILVNSYKDNSFNKSDKIVDYVINTANKIAEQLKADDTNE